MSSAVTITIANPALPAEPGAAARAIEALDTSVAEIRTRIEAGDAIVLAGLDDRVGTVCAAIGGLDAAAARTLLPRLTALTDSLDALQTMLKRRQPRPVAPQRAAEAYGRLR